MGQRDVEEGGETRGPETERKTQKDPQIKKSREKKMERKGEREVRDRVGSMCLLFGKNMRELGQLVPWRGVGDPQGTSVVLEGCCLYSAQDLPCPDHHWPPPAPGGPSLGPWCPRELRGAAGGKPRLTVEAEQVLLPLPCTIHLHDRHREAVGRGGEHSRRQGMVVLIEEFWKGRREAGLQE